MKKYIKLSVGCLECTNSHYIYGAFNSREEAENANEVKQTIESEFAESQTIILEIDF